MIGYCKAGEKGINMNYIIDKDEKYEKAVFDLLLQHNTKQIGSRSYYGKSFYVENNGALVAGMNVFLSWNWASIGEVYYTDLEDLQALVACAFATFKGDCKGLSFDSNFFEITEDLKRVGFVQTNKYKYSPLSTDYHFLELTKPLSRVVDYSGVRVCDKKDEKHQEVIEEQSKMLKSKYKIQEFKSKLSVIALEDEKFVGGVVGEVFDDFSFVDLLVVKEEYRNKDVATRLMKLYEENLDRSIATVTLNTTSFQARGFYEKVGYKTVVTKLKFMDDFDSFSMIKELK